ncbi:MAG: glutathione S-transferase family protein, partial [Rhodobacteraceae bacterium]|nr:glutathione S-transferase family protein [Paracoccaceae bacterium]
VVRWALEECGAAYETVIIEFGEEMKGPDYLAINPMGKVPAIRHGEDVVTECAAICAYLADAFPDAGLLPEAGERAAYFRWLFFAAGPLEQAVVTKSLEMDMPADKSMTLGFGTYENTIDTLEGHFNEKTFVCGKRFTMADVYVGSHIAWGLSFGTLPKRPSFEAYAERIMSRDANRRARTIEDALIAEREAKP